MLETDIWHYQETILNPIWNPIVSPERQNLPFEMGVTQKPATFQGQCNIEVSPYRCLLKLQTHTQSKKKKPGSLSCLQKLASNILFILCQHNH